MSTSITKQGILLADGVEVGENIIVGSSPEEQSFTIPSSSYSDRFGPITTKIPSGTKYTLSFYAKADVEGAKIRTHYYSPNTTTTCVSSQGTTKTASDGNMDFVLTTEWKRYWVTYTQNETTAVKHVICPRVCSQAMDSAQKTGKVYWKMVKFEEGTIATPWTPATTDDIYVGDHGFFEGSDKGSIGKGYMEGNEFYEY